MIEEEWLTSTKSWKLLRFLESQKLPDRKWRLFACASVRRVWHLVTEPTARQAVEVAERYADGQVELKELEQVCYTASKRAWPSQRGYAPYTADFVASQTGLYDTHPGCGVGASWVAGMVWEVIMAVTGGYSESNDAEWHAEECRLLRHIFGNPFKTDSATGSWPSTIVEITATVYDGQDNRLVLADALEEVGHQELAEHFRKEEWHPKGCFAMDLILGKK
jgi:hypothetical protein